MKKAFLLFLFAIILIHPAHIYAWGGSPLTLTYSGGTGVGQSDSNFPENKWNYRYQYHVFVLSGDVPQGSLFSQIQLEERDYKTGIGYARLNLYGSTYSIDLGDGVTNFSDITLNNMAYQGASVTLKPASNFSMTVVGGSRGNGMWGADVRRDTRLRENFTGFKTVYYPGYGFGLTTTYLTTPGGADVFAYGSEYTFKDLKLGAEYGSALEGKAFRGEVKYQTSWYYLGTIYRDVDPTYVVPFDYLSYKGMKGTYTSAGITPNNNLSLNVQSDSYIDRLNGDPYIANVETRGDLSYNMDSGTNIGYSGWRNNRSAYDRGGITEGEMMYITQQFYLLTRNAIYYRNQPTWFESLNSSEESYSENKNVTGINIALLDALHLNYEIENTTRMLKSTDVVIKPSAVSIRADLFESQIAQSAFYVASSVNYRKDIPDKNSTEESTSVYSDVTLKYKPSQDLNCYITAKVFETQSPDADRTARQQKDISFGLTYSFSSNIYLK
jgi:hypothetical protein